MKRSTVPCSGCTACCRDERIILHPEDGDVVSDYITEVVPHPFSGKPVHVIPHAPGGGCIYLVDGGCSIWGRAPLICRKFDCRGLFIRFTSAQRRKMVKAGVLTREVLQAGKERLGSL